MPSFIQALKSQIGRKILTGLTGLGLIIFVVFHLIGNLKLFGASTAFNIYTHTLESLGWILYTLEILLAIGFLLHAYLGISIWWKRRKSRPENYDEYQGKQPHLDHNEDHNDWASRSMIFTGIVLLVFLVLHLKTFKFGDTAPIVINGTQMRNLKALVIETFQNPWYAFGYTFVMILLGIHLKHGFWSAFTSLSMKRKKYSAVIYTIGIIVALLLTVGFLFIPLYIYFTGGQGALIAY